MKKTTIQYQVIDDLVEIKKIENVAALRKIELEKGSGVASAYVRSGMWYQGNGYHDVIYFHSKDNICYEKGQRFEKR